jgi:molybdate transport system substrate-binding protein
MVVRAWLSLAVLSGTSGCGSSAPQAGRPDPEPLRVAVASDLQGVLPAIATRFRAASGIEVVPVFGASGSLAQQIGQGAPYDVFLSANEAFVRQLAQEGHIEAGSVRAYARGRLVLVVNKGSGARVESLADLARPEVKRVALANPGFAPYGLAARQALEKARLWEALGPKLVQAETVRQALQFVQTGNAEAGLVAHSVAQLPEVRTVEVDPGLHAPILQGLGVVARSKHREAARRFAAYLLGEEGQRLLASYGFGPAPGREL